MTFSLLELFLLFAAGTPSVTRADTVHGVPFDTTLAVATGAHLTLDVATGGAVRITGGEAKTIHVRVTELGRHCADCAIVVTHSQSGIMGHHMARILKERGHLEMLKGLVTVEGGCSLPNSGLTAADFDKIPYLAVKGDYTVTSPQCQQTVNAIKGIMATMLLMMFA